MNFSIFECRRRRPPPPPEQIGDKGNFVEATAERRQDILNPSRTEIAKMMNENLTNSFFSSQLFLDACKLWQEQQDTGTCYHPPRR